MCIHETLSLTWRRKALGLLAASSKPRCRCNDVGHEFQPLEARR